MDNRFLYGIGALVAGYVGIKMVNKESYSAENRCSICSGTGHNSRTCPSPTMSICGKCGGSDFISESYYDGQIYCQKCEVFIPTNELKTVKNPKWKEMFGAESFAADSKKNCGCGQDPCKTYGAETFDADTMSGMICNCGNTSGWIVHSFDGQNQPPEGCFNRVYHIECPSCSEYVTTYQRRNTGLRSPFKKGYDAESFNAEGCSHIFGESAYQDANCSRCGKENDVYVLDGDSPTICSCGNRMNGYTGRGIDVNTMRGKSVCERCGVFNAESFSADAYGDEGKFVELVVEYNLPGDPEYITQLLTGANMKIISMKDGDGYYDAESFAAEGIRKSRYGYILDLEVMEGNSWDDLREVIEKYTSNWRESGVGWGDYSVYVMDSSEAKLKELKEEIESSFGDIRFGAESFSADTSKGNEILRQLGGRRFMMMVGGKQPTWDDKKNELSMKIGKNSLGANWFVVHLNPKDLYNLRFESRRMNRKTYDMSIKVKAERYDVYADQLQDIFEKATGLYTHMAENETFNYR